MEIVKTTSWRRSLARNHGVRAWLGVLLAISLLLSLPIWIIGASLAQTFSDTWVHLSQTVLKDYILNSLILMLGVALGTFTFGATTAWLTTVYEFPGRKVLSWALLLPMAVPAYIIAYTYTGILDYSGPVQTQLREFFGWQNNDYWFPQIRSIGGAIFMFSLVLYPYVYLLARNAFINQSQALLEVSRSLGLKPVRIFFKLAIPAARPALVAGITLALMETLADYGTVHYFGVSTFTTGIFRTWFGMGELKTAAQLATLLLIFVTSLIVIENLSRRRQRFYERHTTPPNAARLRLNKTQQWFATAACFAPLLFGFLLPALQLSIWLSQSWKKHVNAEFAQLMLNSFGLAALAAVVCLSLAILIIFSHRLTKKIRLSDTLFRFTKLGYAIPGTIIAVGVLIPFAAIDNSIDSWTRQTLGFSTGLLLSGTLFALTFAYAVRFVPVAIQSLEAGYTKLSPNLEYAARTLGRRPSQLLKEIHFPLLRTSMLSALILVFVDVLKELPATLILRPFNFNTLAVQAYELASDERLADAAAPALAIVIVGILPVIILSKMIISRKPNVDKYAA